VFRWSILVGSWLPRLAGESRRVGYVGGGIGGDAGKMLVYTLQRHSCRDGSKGKESEREGQKKWLYSLVVEVLEITRQTRLEIDSRDNEGTRVSTTAGARDQQEEGASTTAAHLEHAARLLADLWEFLSLSCTSLSSRGTLVANGAESIYRRKCLCVWMHIRQPCIN
jgi:hypothetical protein